MKILSNIKPTFYNVYEPHNTYTRFNINENQTVTYKHTNKSNNDILVDLLECNAYGTALLYLNENYELEVGKFTDIFTESNNTVEDYYSDCEELLTKNIKIVEEAGIPLININGYQIFEGDGYILRGNGAKKIKESFINEELDLFPSIKNKVQQMINDNTNKNDIYDFIQGQVNAYSIDKTEAEQLKELVSNSNTIENLANQLVEFSKGYDSYDFNDQYNSDEDAFESFKSQLLDDKKLAGIIRYIESVISDFDETQAKDDFTISTFNLLHDLKELQNKNINEDVEGTQVSDIASKIDQDLRLEKPKKKYYDILLSDISESLDILNKGFLKNSKGQYQRGNYILVKEGAKYLAVHKDKLKEDIK